MELECGLLLIRYSLLCINYTRKSPVFRNNRNNLSLSENCNCKHNITICQLFQMEKSRLKESGSLFDHILLGKPLHYRFSFWTLLSFITLQDFFISCLSKEYLSLTHFLAKSLPSFGGRAGKTILWKNTTFPHNWGHISENIQLTKTALFFKSFINQEPSDLTFGKA